MSTYPRLIASAAAIVLAGLLCGWTPTVAHAQQPRVPAQPTDEDVLSFAELVFRKTPAEDFAHHLDDPDPQARTFAISGLARHQDRRAVKPLMRELKAWADTGDVARGVPQPNPASGLAKLSIRYQLTAAATILPDTSYIPFLEELVAKNAGDEELRDALGACRRFAAQRSTAPPPSIGRPANEPAAPAAVRLDDPAVLADPARLREALDSATPEALLAGIEAANSLGRDFEKHLILRECFRRPEPDITAAAKPWAESEDARKRGIAALSLTRLAPTEVVTVGALSILITLTDDPVADVAKAALDAIEIRMPGERGLLKTLKAGQHVDAGVRAHFVRKAYGANFVGDWLEGEGDILALTAFLSDPAPEVRAEATESVSVIAGDQELRDMVDKPEVRASLRANASDEKATPALRGVSIAGLAMLKDVAAVPLIERALSSDRLSEDDADFHHNIILAAGEMPRASYVAGLERLKKRQDEQDSDDGGMLDEVIDKCRKAGRQ